MNRSVLRGIVLIALAAVVIGGLMLMPGSGKAKKSHPPNNDPWVLVSYDPNNPYGTYLGNGFIATRILADGVGKECYMAGLYDDEKLIPTPNWADFRLYDGKTRFEIDKDEPYKQTLNMKTGIVTTEATWRAGRKTLTGKIHVVVSRDNRCSALINAAFTPNFDGMLRAESPLAYDSNILVSRYQSGDILGTCASRSFSTKDGGLFFGYHGKLAGTAEHGSGSKTRWPVTEAKVVSGTEIKFSYVVAVSQASTELLALEGAHSMLPKTSGVETGDYIPAHKAAMAKLWEKDIIIDGPVKDQQAVRSCMFYLMQSVREGSQWSIPPMGLSNNAFSGHVFWDADLWMFPALILQHPKLAKSIVDYRYNTLPGAFANARADGYTGAQYAWESGFTGIEDTPPGLVYRHERHINGDVAIAQWQYYLATGDLNWLKDRGFPVLKATADWWASKAKFNKEKNRYEILQVVPPDENAELVDNSVYTNAIAQMNLRIAARAAKLTGKPANGKWSEVADKMYIPYDAANKRFIAHDNYKGYLAKQADTELLAYPLQVTVPGVDMNEVYKNNFEFYAANVHKNGPAMTSSAHSVIAARLGDKDRAYADFIRSYKPYLRGPFNFFNEKASKTVDNMCFLTGAAGPIQAILFGIAGARMDYFPADAANAQLEFKPCLPDAWKSVKITGIEWRGKTFDVVLGKSGTAQVLPHKE